ncbi:uncharacterized protein SAPINGB_P002375 [Magnusiomyces paraingens]|uniref:Pre-mRNA-processing protein PRP40 n=1 Tax=Magnusiomyces paraingens TaxID=2606893 RepID=A0A5E8BFP3_9ASCO|nr:uncharacterized protein SAPINGB_P002375 [Saprochaete ingens]VVT49651.1 unnamed protein product [Saprochaete ingens]
MSVWQSHTSEDGRVYYYNSETAESSWEKPDELLTPLERALAKSRWKEYTAEGGSKYWYHEDTQESVWEIPDEIKKIIEANNPEIKDTEEPEATKTSAGPTYDTSTAIRGDAFKYTSQSQLAQAKIPKYDSEEAATQAFKGMLRERQIDGESHTWASAMKLLIRDPRYWAVTMPLDRKRAFDEWSDEIRRERAEKRRQAREEQLQAMTLALTEYPSIKYYTRWRTVKDSIMTENPIFRDVDDPKLCHYAFNVYRKRLRNSYESNLAREREVAMAKLETLLGTMGLSASSSQWLDTLGELRSMPKFSDDPRLSTMARADVLATYESFIRNDERRQNDQVQKLKKLQRRKERKVREAFVGLLQELHSKGLIKARTKWMDTRPIFEKDQRYIDICGQPGSTPLELFWDLVEEERRKLKLQREQVIDVLTAKKFAIDDGTKFEEFAKFVQTTMATTHSISEENLETIFEDIKAAEAKKREEDRYADERRIIRAQNDLRALFKELDNPPIGIDDKWEDVRPRVINSEEYTRVPTEELRREAFDRYIRRLQERERDVRERRRKLPASIPPPAGSIPSGLPGGLPSSLPNVLPSSLPAPPHGSVTATPHGSLPPPPMGIPGRYPIPRGYPPPPPPPYYRGGYDPHQPFLKY